MSVSPLIRSIGLSFGSFCLSFLFFAFGLSCGIAALYVVLANSVLRQSNKSNYGDTIVEWNGKYRAQIEAGANYSVNLSFSGLAKTEGIFEHVLQVLSEDDRPDPWHGSKKKVTGSYSPLRYVLRNVSFLKNQPFAAGSMTVKMSLYSSEATLILGEHEVELMADASFESTRKECNSMGGFWTKPEPDWAGWCDLRWVLCGMCISCDGIETKPAARGATHPGCFRTNSKSTMYGDPSLSRFRLGSFLVGQYCQIPFTLGTVSSSGDIVVRSYKDPFLFLFDQSRGLLTFGQVFPLWLTFCGGLFALCVAFLVLVVVTQMLCDVCACCHSRNSIEDLSVNGDAEESRPLLAEGRETRRGFCLWHRRFGVFDRCVLSLFAVTGLSLLSASVVFVSLHNSNPLVSVSQRFWWPGFSALFATGLIMVCFACFCPVVYLFPLLRCKKTVDDVVESRDECSLFATPQGTFSEEFMRRISSLLSEQIATLCRDSSGTIRTEQRRWFRCSVSRHDATAILEHGVFVIQELEPSVVVRVETRRPRHLVDPSLVTLVPGEDGHLGRGSFGVVRRGVLSVGLRDLPIAVKRVFCRSGDHLEAEREVRLMAEVAEHENILRCYGCFMQNDVMNLVLDLCDGGCLLAWLRKKERRNELSPRLKLAALLQCARGCLHLHSEGIIHRDLKPENLLIMAGQVKICDFGLSRRESSLSTLNLKGTIGYIPNPRHRDVEKLSSQKKADVYAFGIVVFEVWTLERAYEQERTTHDDISLLGLIHPREGEGLRPVFPPDCGIPDRLRALCCRCWMDHPDDRPLFGEIVRELSDLQSEFE